MKLISTSPFTHPKKYQNYCPKPSSHNCTLEQKWNQNAEHLNPGNQSLNPKLLFRAKDSPQFDSSHVRPRMNII